MSWISVKDELPPVWEAVIVYVSKERPWIGIRIEDEWYDPFQDDWITGVTHWQKLPEPPEEG